MQDAYVFLPIMPVVVGVVSACSRMIYARWKRRSTAGTERRFDGATAESRRNAPLLWYCGAAAAGCGGCGAGFLWRHTELDPATGRRRLYLFSDSLLKRVADEDTDRLLGQYHERGTVLDNGHPVYERVERLTRRLLESNGDVDAIRDGRWYVVVIDEPQANAFSLPNNFVFVFAGMLADGVDDDQLSVIIGHEISHCAHRHVNQLQSCKLVVDVARLVPIAVIWARLPFAAALFVHQLFSTAVQLFLFLPHRRHTEFEADRDGFMLAAKACVDVTRGHRYWTALAENEELSGANDYRPWWIRTHPTHRDRAERLYALIPEARELQKSANC